jgi:hypothetical protein
MLLDRFKTALDRHRAVRQAYHAVFATTEGKIVLTNLLQVGGVLETSMVSGDPQATAYREGRRSMALDVIHKLRWTEGEMMQLALQRTGDQLAAQTEQEA